MARLYHKALLISFDMCCLHAGGCRIRCALFNFDADATYGRQDEEQGSNFRAPMEFNYKPILYDTEDGWFCTRTSHTSTVIFGRVCEIELDGNHPGLLSPRGLLQG